MPLSAAPLLFPRVRLPLAEAVAVQRAVVQPAAATVEVAAAEVVQPRRQASDQQRRRRTSRHTVAFRWF